MDSATHENVPTSATHECVPTMSRVRQARLCGSRRTDGHPCRAFSINGGTVCWAHGGAAPRVRRAAADRLLEQCVRAAVDHDERRYRERLVDWHVDCILATAELRGIDPEDVTRPDVWVSRAWHPERFRPEPERRCDRRFGRRLVQAGATA